MSMLTAQANHLREMAYTVERVKDDAVGKLSLSGSIALAMAAMDMRDAADTIAQLRNTCHDLRRENEELKTENAKLRELVARIARYKFYPCDGCMHREWCDSHPVDLLTPRAWCPEQVDIENECKVLGIEVDE